MMYLCQTVILYVAVSVLVVHVCMAAEYGIDYILSDGTVISIPTRDEIRSNMGNQTWMRIFNDNMTYIDNDAFESTGRMIFSTFTAGETHKLEPYLALEDRHYHRRQWHNNTAPHITSINNTYDVISDRTELAKRSSILVVSTYFSEGYKSYYRTDGYNQYYHRYYTPYNYGFKSQYWTPYCSECSFTWFASEYLHSQRGMCIPPCGSVLSTIE
ncbi:hypothetical protein V1509DRAFT_636269 [Lipomyces kononenkoae]